jgi:hypothetical protein
VQEAQIKYNMEEKEKLKPVPLKYEIRQKYFQSLMDSSSGESSIDEPK